MRRAGGAHHEPRPGRKARLGELPLGRHLHRRQVGQVPQLVEHGVELRLGDSEVARVAELPEPGLKIARLERRQRVADQHRPVDDRVRFGDGHGVAAAPQTAGEHHLGACPMAYDADREGPREARVPGDSPRRVGLVFGDRPRMEEPAALGEPGQDARVEHRRQEAGRRRVVDPVVAAGKPHLGSERRGGGAQEVDQLAVGGLGEALRSGALDGRRLQGSPAAVAAGVLLVELEDQLTDARAFLGVEPVPGAARPAPFAAALAGAGGREAQQGEAVAPRLVERLLVAGAVLFGVCGLLPLVVVHRDDSTGAPPGSKCDNGRT